MAQPPQSGSFNFNANPLVAQIDAAVRTLVARSINPGAPDQPVVAQSPQSGTLIVNANPLVYNIDANVKEILANGVPGGGGGGTDDPATGEALGVLQDSVTSVYAKILEIQTKLLSIEAQIAAGGVIVIPDPPSDWPSLPQPDAGVTRVISAGGKVGSMHIDNLDVIIQGSGMRVTVIDGRGGIDGGHRLAFGKGMIHMDKDGTVMDMGFMGNFDPGGNSDGEAGVYCEGGTMTVIRCAFDKCEDGGYMQPREFLPAPKIAHVVMDSCVFGRLGANGLDDGRSHDIYMGGLSVTIRNSIFVGNSRANTIKVRGNRLILENNYIGRSNGRWVDLPGGTEFDSSGNTFVSNDGANSNNTMGFFDELDVVNTDGEGYWHSLNDTFIFGFHSSHREVFWKNRPTFDVVFTNPTVYWVGADASAPPPELYWCSDPGAGDLITPPATNPFIFDESNRITALPPIPLDPASPP